MDPVDRFMSKVEVTDGCWEWSGAVQSSGYGNFWAGGVHYLAHRFSYETFVGHIPDGFVIDHLCRNRTCVCPEHLEPVTQSKNVHRSPYTLVSLNSAKTECHKGHHLSGKNLYTCPSGTRYCKECRRRRDRDRWPRRKSELQAKG